MPKINFRVILKFIGILLCMEAVFMLIPFFVALYYNDGDAPAFIKSILITAFTGSALFYFFKDSRNEVGKRESYLVVTSIWFFFYSIRDVAILLHAQLHEHYRCLL